MAIISTKCPILNNGRSFAPLEVLIMFDACDGSPEKVICPKYGTGGTTKHTCKVKDNRSCIYALGWNPFQK